MATASLEERQELDGRASGEDLIEAARRLTPQIRALADRIEAERRLPLALVRAIAEAGLFQMIVPRQFGGRGADLRTMFRVLEEISAADGSVGWCVMTGCQSNGMLAGWAAESVAAEILGTDPYVVVGGSTGAAARTVAIDGGYRVTGRWRFNSGIHHCTWLFSLAAVYDGDTPRRREDGAPVTRYMIFPTAQSEIIDTWDVLGMRGTDSHDNAVTELFVPAERTFDLFLDPPVSPLPIFRFPVAGFGALGAAGVATGIARGAIEAFKEIARVKKPTGSSVRLGERAAVQVQVAQAEVLLRSARAFVLEAVSEIWEALHAGRPLAIEQRAALRLACSSAATASAEAVDLMYRAAGTTAIVTGSPLERCFRDIHVLTQHYAVQPSVYEAAGQALIGPLDPLP